MNVNFKPSVQERMLEAFLDLIILQMLQYRSMTAYQIDNLIMDKYHSKISPSVTYAKLATMERLGLIDCHLHNGKAYNLTEKGKELLDTKAIIVKEIRSNTVTLFEINQNNKD